MVYNEDGAYHVSGGISIQDDGNDGLDLELPGA